MQDTQNNKTAEKEESDEYKKEMAEAYRKFIKIHLDESILCDVCKEKYLK